MDSASPYGRQSQRAGPQQAPFGGRDETMSDSQRWPDSSGGDPASGNMGGSGGSRGGGDQQQMGRRMGLPADLRTQMTPAECA